MRNFKDVFIKHGIKHQLSSPHTPQQNGTAERSWHTGFDMARCLLLQSGLPKYMWNYRDQYNNDSQSDESVD